ncbi:hypothetical protein VTL71DRAFT_13283 [Oculimacula yallundae]|uniref:Uncharacterized protein n=1 Tax=Oculimacula yallundae TaxID=86028 RepID=A0ABR4CKI9_9HELO
MAWMAPRQYLHVYNGVTYITERGLFGSTMIVPTPKPSTTVAKTMFEFFTASFIEPRSRSIVWDDGTETDFNTAVYKDLSSEALSLGSEGLCGCTVLLVVSRTGVYMSYYFESLAFSPDDV